MNKIIITTLALIITSCATLMKGTSQLVTINCNVDGATIYLDGVEIGKTPFTGEIKKGKKILLIKKDGYKPYSSALSTSLEGIFWGNIITGGTLGSITDFASGAAYAYAPASFQIELIKKGMSLNDFEKIINLKKFAMINMSNIAIDLSNNNGPYLNSLLQLASLDGDQNDVNLIRKNLIISKGDQVIFGKLMVSLLDI